MKQTKKPKKVAWKFVLVQTAIILGASTGIVLIVIAIGLLGVGDSAVYTTMFANPFAGIAFIVVLVTFVTVAVSIGNKFAEEFADYATHVATE